MSHRISWWKISLLTLTCGFSSLAGADEATYSLVYRFQSGQFLHYETDDRAEMTTQFASNQSKSVQQTQLLKSFRVVTVDESGGATIEPIVEKVRMSSQSGEKGVVSFDSTNGEAPPKEFEKIAGTIGRPIARFQVSSNGRMVKVTLLVKDVPKSFSDAAEKLDPIINFLVVLPDKPVKIGEKWSEKFETPVSVGSGLSQSITLIRTFELAKVADNIATIRSRTSLLTPTSDPEILRQLVQLTPTGSVEFDLQQGQILSKSLQIDEKVVGAFGAQTLLQARGESMEKMVSPNGAPRVATGTPNPVSK